MEQYMLKLFINSIIMPQPNQWMNESFLFPKSGVNVMWSQIILVTLSKNFTKQGDTPMPCY